jgi:[acyl-carrier-protein] S-malonyltransferase
VVHNVTAAVETNPEKIKGLMIEQIYSPVRWVECVNAMVAKGTTSTLECGPGKVLSGLNKRIHAELATVSVEKPEELQLALASLA